MTFLSFESHALELGCALPADKLETKTCLDWASLQGMDVQAWVCPASVVDPVNTLKINCPHGKIVKAESLNLRALHDDRDIADLAEVKRVGTCVRGNEAVPLWVCAPEKSRPENLRPSSSEVKERRQWLESNQDQRNLVEKTKDAYDDLKEKKQQLENLKNKPDELKNKAKSAQKLLDKMKPSTPSLPSTPSVPSVPSVPSTPSLPKTQVTDPQLPLKQNPPADLQKKIPGQTN